jgi:hypothetical protein
MCHAWLYMCPLLKGYDGCRALVRSALRLRVVIQSSSQQMCWSLKIVKLQQQKTDLLHWHANVLVCRLQMPMKIARMQR